MPDEWKDEGMKAHQHEYDQTIWQLLGDPLLYVDLKNDPELADIKTPSLNPIMMMKKARKPMYLILTILIQTPIIVMSEPR